ncbi:MAG: apolipoprotein N-acyltransferase [Tangfeifania sp.]
MSRLTHIGLSVLSGGLLSLAWLGFPGWTLFFALIPLLFIDRFYVENKDSYRSVSFWFYAFLTFLIWNGITTWWIAYATFLGAVLAIVVNSFLMSLVWWLAHTARRYFKSNLGYVALVVFWISFEFFHFRWDIEWPWLTLGNGFANNIKMVQWYEYTGTLGGSLWILTMNILFFNILQNLKKRAGFRSLFYPVTGYVILLVVPLFYSFTRYADYTEKGNPIEVVVLQPNVDPYNERFDRAAENEKLEKLIRLARSKADEKTDLIIGPETIFESSLDWDEAQLHNNFHYRRLSQLTAEYPNAEIIFGATTLIFYDSKEEATITSREYNGRFYDIFNSAIFIERTGENQIYHKSILVNGVEKIPFMEYLGFLRNIFIDLGGASGSLGSQNEASVFELKDESKAAPVICYESVFGEYLTDYVKKGAEFIVIITNDGWWRNTPGYKQHLSFARLRAIETRRSIARSANTGISAFINQRGDLVQTTQWWSETAIKDTVKLNDEITFYVRYGDYIARVSVFVSVLLILYLFVRKKTQK